MSLSSSQPLPSGASGSTEPSQISITSLHLAVLREAENDSLQEIDSNFYRDTADFIGELSRQEFVGVEQKIKAGMVGMATEMVSLLIRLRMDKISRSPSKKMGSFLDEEKFIMDSQEERKERLEMIVSASTSGRSEFLASLAYGHRSRRIVVRFLKDVDEIVGADLDRYGPFEAESVATIPYENALALISQDAAARVRWHD